MSPPEDLPLYRRIHRALDAWFAPPWRALLTWLALVGLTFAAVDVVGSKALEKVIEWPLKLFAGVLSRRLFFTVRGIVTAINFMLLIVWFEPFALRLDLPRGIAWLALRIAPHVAPWFFGPIYGLSPYTAAELLCAVVAVLVLRGWRSRPWMCIIGVALSFAVDEWVSGTPYPSPTWLAAMIGTFPLAVLLLCGTRLLSPEERAQT